MKPILHILTRVSTSIQKEEGYGLDVQLSEGKSVAEMLGFDLNIGMKAQSVPQSVI